MEEVNDQNFLNQKFKPYLRDLFHDLIVRTQNNEDALIDSPRKPARKFGLIE